MGNGTRPEPDELLARFKDQETASARGTFRLFFGMCAGVGKTWAMLEEARSERKSGRDIVIAAIDTHGRPETDEMLAGIETLPLRQIEYRGIVLGELDVEAVLRRRPAIVIVDELAHTNAPGSIHVKRWQDVLEILDHGISVWTALNVQHVESLSDVVEDLTSVSIRERVPDTVIDRADEIRLIDVAPEDLVRRLAEGKVYTKDRARHAADNFFKPRTLGALRELALRFATRAAERRLRGYARAESLLEPGGSVEGKILVAIGPAPSSAYLVRWSRRTAYALKAAWVAVHIDSGKSLSEADTRRLEDNLGLARKLGAETLVVQSPDIARALIATARDHSASMIVIGRSGLSRPGFFPRPATVSDRIVRDAGPIAVAVVEDASARGPDISLPALRRFFVTPLRQYALLAASFGLFLVVGRLLSFFLGHREIALVYLAAILALSFVAKPGPVAILAVLSALGLNFFFIPPLYTFSIASVEDLVLFAVYFLVAFVTSGLVTRLRANERIIEVREDRAAFLFQASERLAACRTTAEAAEAAARIVEEHFDMPAAIFVSDSVGQMSGALAGKAAGAIDTRERAAAAAAYGERSVCGRGTDSLPGAKLRYLPAVLGERSSGVIGLEPPEGRAWKGSDDSLLLSLGRSFALIVEREHSEARSREAILELESERLSTVLLDTVSHELRTPLTTITGSLSALMDEELAKRTESRRALLEGALEASARLDRIVEDILSMSRIESGSMRLALSLVDLDDIAREALAVAGPELDEARIRVIMPADALPVRVDLALSARLAGNLLRNAARYSPPSSPVELIFIEEGGALAMRVRDHGPGVDKAELETIFDRFRRGAKAPGGGLGLGLAICRGIARAHGGSIEAHNSPQGGLEVTAMYPSCVWGATS